MAFKKLISFMPHRNVSQFEKEIMEIIWTDFVDRRNKVSFKVS